LSHVILRSNRKIGKYTYYINYTYYTYYTYYSNPINYTQKVVKIVSKNFRPVRTLLGGNFLNPWLVQEALNLKIPESVACPREW
jgi:hypothetical protein